MRSTGLLMRWDDTRGYGFIAGPDGESVFVHISAFAQGARRPLPREAIRYERATDARGRPYARKAAFVQAARAGRSGVSAAARPSSAGTAICILLLCAWIAAAGAHKLLSALPMLYAAACAATFAAYAIDKSAAMRGRRRVPENTLHALNLLGGWPGAIAARQLLRHKLRKPAFRRLFWLTAILHCALLGCLLWGVET